MGFGGSWSSLLRRLVVPADASSSDPRVVIATDDPLALLLSQDASIMWYWAEGRAFLISVEQSGGPGRGQLHMWGADESRVGGYVTFDFDAATSGAQDGASYSGGLGGVTVVAQQDLYLESNSTSIEIIAYNDDADPFEGNITLDAESDVRIDYGTQLLVQGRPALTPWYSEIARGNLDIDLTAATQDVPGCTLTINGLPAGMRWEAESFLDMRNLLTNATTGVVECNVSGAVESSQVIFSGRTSGVRATAGQFWEGVTPSAGNYTWKLQAFRAGGADASVRIAGLHSGIRVRLYV